MSEQMFLENNLKEKTAIHNGVTYLKDSKNFIFEIKEPEGDYKLFVIALSVVKSWVANEEKIRRKHGDLNILVLEKTLFDEE